MFLQISIAAYELLKSQFFAPIVMCGVRTDNVAKHLLSEVTQAKNALHTPLLGIPVCIVQLLGLSDITFYNWNMFD